MKEKVCFKDILLYLILPEDTTEAGGADGLLDRLSLYPWHTWLGPLKTVMWVSIAIAGPLLFLAVLRLACA